MKIKTQRKDPHWPISHFKIFFFFFFYLIQIKNIGTHYTRTIELTVELTCITLKVAALVAMELTSYKIRGGATLICICRLWWCWRYWRSSKMGMSCHLCLLWVSPKFSKLLSLVSTIKFLKPSLKAIRIASPIAVAFVMIMSLCLVLWQPAKMVWPYLVFPNKAIPCHLLFLLDFPAVITRRSQFLWK